MAMATSIVIFSFPRGVVPGIGEHQAGASTLIIGIFGPRHEHGPERRRESYLRRLRRQRARHGPGRLDHRARQGADRARIHADGRRRTAALPRLPAPGAPGMTDHLGQSGSEPTLGVIYEPHFGVGDRGTVNLWFSVYVTESSAALKCSMSMRARRS